jgi:hypothetical protein
MSEMKPATQIVHWPGRDTAACEDHLRKLVGLGAILGIMISWTPCEETVCENCKTEAVKREAPSGHRREGERVCREDRRILPP